MTPTEPRNIEALLRELAPRALGPVARRFRDFAAAEDAVQEALLAAAAQWPIQGIPQHPRTWLIQVASRRMTDFIRAESARRRREGEFALEAPPHMKSREDDSLLLLFMCCHPVLTPASAIALTLRAIGGLTTAEIAHAFLVPEATMAQRISRAKQTIKSSGIRFELPSAEDHAARLRSVLRIVYLIFNEGYAATAGAELRRDDLSFEAIRLARLVRKAQPFDAEAAGLLALLLLTHARRRARTTPDGELIPLEQQDRSHWDRKEIAEGVAILSAALPSGQVGPYQLQAAIAALHDEADSTESTDWPQILALYDLLDRVAPSPMAQLNRAVAAAMVHGAPKGLELLSALDSDPRLAAHHRLDAVRAHLLERAGDPEAAARHYRAAAAKTFNLPERHYLLMRAARLLTPDRQSADNGA